MDASTSKSIVPEEQLKVLKLIINLRKLGDTHASEKLRNRVRKALLEAEDDEKAATLVDNYVRIAEKVQSRLDGSLDRKREQKRARREEREARASQYVDIEAESGDDENSGDDDEDN